MKPGLGYSSLSYQARACPHPCDGRMSQTSTSHDARAACAILRDPNARYCEIAVRGDG